jgi:hypothetical protein
MNEHFIKVESADSPLLNELAYKWKLTCVLGRVLEGLLMPLDAVARIHEVIDEVPSPGNGEMIPIMVGMDCIAICVYREENGKWYVSPLLDLDLDVADPPTIAANMTIAVFDADQERRKVMDEMPPE